MLSVIKGVQPRDQIEAMLAAQMAAVHMATMTFARRLAHVENIPQQDSAERAFNKLTRTFATQMEALKRYRTGGEQKVTVQHVSVAEGGQAIVGNVTQAQRENVPGKAAASPPLALTNANVLPMPIMDESKEQRPRCQGGANQPNDRRITNATRGPCFPARAAAPRPARAGPAGHRVQGKKRCRMHGGAPGSGAPRGNKNALKHGLYTRDAIEERRQLRALMRQSRMLIQDIE